MSERHILIIGATSAIAERAARRLAARGHSLAVAGRDRERLEDIAADLCNRGAAGCSVHAFNAERPDTIPDLFEAAAGHRPVTDVLIAHALPQPGSWPGEAGLQRYVRVNTTSAIACMHEAAEHFASYHGGLIAWLSSPAALRGRRRNWLYGASKAAGDIALEGIGGKYREAGVRTLLLRPGPTRTAFNAGLQPAATWSEPQTVGERIGDLIHARATGECFIPRIWWLPATILRWLPTFVLSRLKG